jgi:hypothetical protein
MSIFTPSCCKYPHTEGAKAIVEEYDSELILSSQAKMEISRRQALLSQVHQTVKGNSKLGGSFKDPLQKGNIARVGDGKTLKKALVMVKDVLKKEKFENWHTLLQV